MIFAFIAVIGLVNFYLYRIAVSAYPEWWLGAGLIVGFLFLSLFVAVYLEKRQYLKASIPFSWIGYSWTGVVGMGLLYGAFFDMLQLFFASLDDRTAFHWIAGATFVSTIWGFISARRIRVKRVRVPSSKSASIGGKLKVVQISDMHLGDSSTLRRTRRVVEEIRRLEPDLVVSTGDLFDGFLSMMGPYVTLLREIKAISGNHEVYAGLEEAMRLTESAGFRVLRDMHFDVGERLRIVGVEDPASNLRKEEDQVISSTSEGFTLLLKHRPDVEASSVGKFDLQLSGHTHGGQIFPFHFLVKLQYRMKPGLSRLGKASYLYLSRGSGSCGPQIRFLAPPELTYLEIGDT